MINLFLFKMLTMRFSTYHKCFAVFLIISLYTVDISAQEGVINLQQDPFINKLLTLQKEVNSTDDEEFFKIQIYNGNLSGAKKSSSEFKLYFPGWECDVFFETPNYKVRVGKFRTRLEADKKLVDVKAKYPSAFILIP
jgi:hypothetical protein